MRRLRTALGMGCLTLGLSGPAAPVPPLVAEIIDQTGDGDGELFAPYGVGVDPTGNAFVTSLVDAAVYRITQAGVVTQIEAPGPGLIVDIDVDDDGDVYVLDQSQNTAARITPGVGFTELIDASGDGAGNPFDYAVAIAVGPSGNTYVAGHASRNVFEITPGGTITEIIDGSGPNGLAGPSDVEVDDAGNVFVADALSDQVVRIAPGGTRTRILGASGDGAGHALDYPYGLAIAPTGDVYVGGGDSDNIFRVTPTGTVTQVLDVTGNGSGHPCEFPTKLALDPEGNLYVACWDSGNVLRVAPDGAVVLLMDETGDGANPMQRPHGLAYHESGRLYVTGAGTHNAFRIDLPSRVPLPWTASLVLAFGILACARPLLRRRAIPAS